MLGRSARVVLVVVAAGCASCAGHPPGDDAVEAVEVESGPYRRASLAAQQGDLEQAEEEVLLALRDNPRHAAAHELYASLLLHRGLEGQAIVGLERSLAFDSSNPRALYNLGTLYLRRGESMRALRMFERASELRPDHAPTFNNLGKAYFQLGLPVLAGAAYEEALALDPDDEIARQSLLLLTTAGGHGSPAGAEFGDQD